MFVENCIEVTFSYIIREKSSHDFFLNPPFYYLQNIFFYLLSYQTPCRCTYVELVYRVTHMSIKLQYSHKYV